MAWALVTFVRPGGWTSGPPSLLREIGMRMWLNGRVFIYLAHKRPGVLGPHKQTSFVEKGSGNSNGVVEIGMTSIGSYI